MRYDFERDGHGNLHVTDFDSSHVPFARRCRSYFYGRGVFVYRHGKRCELNAGHDGPHQNWVDAHFIDPHQHFIWGRK